MKYETTLDESRPAPKWGIGLTDIGPICWCYSREGAAYVAEMLNHRLALLGIAHSCNTQTTVGETRRTEYGRTAINASNLGEIAASFGLDPSEDSDVPVKADLPVKGQETAFAGVSGSGLPNKSSSILETKEGGAVLSTSPVLPDEDDDFREARR